MEEGKGGGEEGGGKNEKKKERNVAKHLYDNFHMDVIFSEGESW